MLRQLGQQTLPPPIRSWVKQKLYTPLTEAYNRWFDREAYMIPPLELMRDGPVDIKEFRRNGKAYLQHYIELGKLERDGAILDVGCGIGRKTIPLTRYLDARGRYEGFDILPSGIAWCQKRITPLYPNFHFQVADVYNMWYQPQGKTPAAEYCFPFADNTFDLVVANSVFTHMLPEDTRNYLSEIGRVLRPGGRCLLTFFLWNAFAEGAAPNAGTALGFDFKLDFKYDYGDYRAISAEDRERVVALREEAVREMYREQGLEILDPIRYGSWSGRTEFLDYQDIVVATKAKNNSE